MRVPSLTQEYRIKKKEIKGRLEDFKKVLSGSEKDVFAELAYCILTAQAKAEEADRAIRSLKKSGILFKGNPGAIKPYLNYVRFWNKKAAYIVKARNLFTDGGAIRLKRRVTGDSVRSREALASMGIGLGYKESSHFLRNIGLGDKLAILDRYILRCLAALGVIEEIPKSLTRRRYLEIEERMKAFSDSVRIPMAHLDLLLWSSQTGKIFK